jgi:hypothetical protein
VNSSYVKFERCKFTGDYNPADSLPLGQGLNIEDSDNITVTNCEFELFHRGIISGGVSNLNITSNNVHSMKSDGLDFYAVTDTLIEDNWVHDFLASTDPGDHRDFIQFWTNGTTTPSERVTIKNNILDIGQGGWAQSIFIRNEEVDNGLAGPEMYYQNFTIEDNYIRNLHLHGITTSEGDNWIIRNNILISTANFNTSVQANIDHTTSYGPSSELRVPTIRVHPVSSATTITGNEFYGAPEYDARNPSPRIINTVTDTEATAQTGWTISGNTIDPTEANAPATPAWPAGSTGPTLPVMGRNITINLTVG